MDFSNRKYVVGLIMLGVAFIFLCRLFYMQIVDNTWKNKAARFTETSLVLTPPRGVIYDRNGKLLVSNQAVYDLMIIPKETQAFDTAAFCELIGDEEGKVLARLQHEDLKRAPRKSHVIIGNITPDEFARISEQLYKFPGFFGQPTTMRHYPHDIAALFLGEVREVHAGHIERDDYYSPGDYIGNSGLEKFYEKDLRGQKGIRYFMRDNFARITAASESELDSAAIPGKTLISTLDIDLQTYGERLMRGKKGCIVAIEPSTGEILSLVNSPYFDPNLLIGRNRGTNYTLLSKDSLNPLFNRSVQGSYRPGSIFKMIQSLIALQRGVISPQTRIPCNRNIIGCHGPHSFDNLEGAIKHSCNPYFRNVMKRMVEAGASKSRFEDAAIGLGKWKKDVQRFGLGTNLYTDIPGVKKGNVPGPEYYDKIYGIKRWAYSTIYSVSIGEGELLVTPLHMANLATIIANRGWYIPPHSVRAIDGEVQNIWEQNKQWSGVDTKHFDLVVNAMSAVVQEDGGTARLGRIDGIEVCGKTGTVQNDPLPDHSVFMAFAPRDNPQIAIAVYVEYAGFGGQWAAPIASLMMEKYLTDSVKQKRKELRILEKEILDY